MQRRVEQRYAIKFCVKLNKSTTETLAMSQETYGKDSLSKVQVFRWHKTFKDKIEDVDDGHRAERHQILELQTI